MCIAVFRFKMNRALLGVCSNRTKRQWTETEAGKFCLNMKNLLAVH